MYASLEFSKILGIVAGELVRKHGRNRDRAFRAETFGWLTRPLTTLFALSYGVVISLRVVLKHG